MQLQPARTEQEGDEHRHRIEVHLVAEDAAGVEGGAAAGDEGDGDADGHRHVHADAARAQAVPSAGEEGAGREQQHRQAQHPAAPVEQLRQVGRQLAGAGHVGRRGQHHHLHHAEGGDEQPPQRLAAFGAAQLARRRGGIGSGVVAGAADGFDQQRRPRALRVPAHRRALPGGADRGAADAVDAVQRLLDDAGAGGAIHARKAQRRFGHALAVTVGAPAREALLLQRVVQDRDARQCRFHTSDLT